MLYAWPHHWRFASLQLEQGCKVGWSRAVPHGEGPGMRQEGPDDATGLFAVFVPDWTPRDLRGVLGILAWRRLLRSGWKPWVDDWFAEDIPF